MRKLRSSAAYTLSLGFLLPLALFVGFLVYEVQHSHEPRDLEASLTEALLAEEEKPVSTTLSDASWREIYPVTVPMKIGPVSLEASVAKTWPERIQGLSGTPYLPEGVAKFFAFETDAFHSIWMKDMQYSIDIIWVDANGVVVDLIQEASPESYPETFTPEVPARYVIEVVSGFVAQHKITKGMTVKLPVW